jgi:DNA replication and repair protein RecF
VFLQRIRLRNFRNFSDETVEFPEQGAALIGENGQGKTNLLEAVYYLEIFRSFRGARDEQLVQFGSDHFRVEGRLSEIGGGAVEVAAAYQREGRRKKVTVNGDEPERIGDAIGRIGVIVFTASDVEIVSGGPAARRRFLDIILSLVEPGYLAALQRYRRILTQRNELLRDGAAPAQLAAWNHELVEAGGSILAARARWVAERRDDFARHYEKISGGQRASVDYAPSIPEPEGDGGRGDEPDSWSEAFHGRLERLAERERRRGMTLAGPHRDELKFWVGDSSDVVGLRSFGSAGQQRTAAVALRMVEAETLRAVLGVKPIIMLDDVFAELDRPRSQRVVELLAAEEWGQVLVTSPKASEFALMGDSLPEYRISGGRVARA